MTYKQPFICRKYAVTEYHIEDATGRLVPAQAAVDLLNRSAWVAVMPKDLVAVVHEHYESLHYYCKDHDGVDVVQCAECRTTISADGESCGEHMPDCTVLLWDWLLDRLDGKPLPTPPEVKP